MILTCEGVFVQSALDEVIKGRVNGLETLGALSPPRAKVIDNQTLVSFAKSQGRVSLQGECAMEYFYILQDPPRAKMPCVPTERTLHTS